MPRRANPKAQRRGECDLDLCAQWVDHVANASENSVVLVNTKKAADILKSYGVKRLIYYQEPEFELIQTIIEFNKPCVLLFDATRPGNKRCEKIRSQLQKNGVRVNTRFRKFLFTTPFKTLNGLLAYIHKHVYDTPRKHAGTRL